MDSHEMRTVSAPIVVTVAVQTCEDCGAAEPRTSLSGVWLCDRCTDRRVEMITGYPEAPEAPPPLEIVTEDGRRHVLIFRIRRSPTGIEVELEEADAPAGEGYLFAVPGAHDANVEELVNSVRNRAEAEVSRRYLELHPNRSKWIVRDDDVAGRLIFSEESGPGGPHDVVIDGRTLTWREFGEALEPYEGWRFRLVIEDPSVDLRPDAHVVELPKRDVD
jgi:hypothetical protein